MRTLITFHLLQCNPHCTSHTAEHTVGAQYMPACVNECISRIPWHHHYWVSEMKGGQECHMLPHLTSLTQSDPRVLYSQVWKGIHSLAPLAQHILPGDSFRHCWQRISIVRSDNKVIPTLENVCAIFSSTGSKTPLSVHWNTDCVCIWKNITQTGLSGVATDGKIYIYLIYFSCGYSKEETIK